jgi:hypothetical protein
MLVSQSQKVNFTDNEKSVKQEHRAPRVVGVGRGCQGPTTGCPRNDTIWGFYAFSPKCCSISMLIGYAKKQHFGWLCLQHSYWSVLILSLSILPFLLPFLQGHREVIMEVSKGPSVSIPSRWVKSLQIIPSPSHLSLPSWSKHSRTRQTSPAALYKLLSHRIYEHNKMVGADVTKFRVVCFTSINT